MPRVFYLSIATAAFQTKAGTPLCGIPVCTKTERTVFSALCRLACQAQIVGIKLCKVPGKRHGAGTDLAGFYFVCLRKRRNCSAAGENVWSFFHASTVPVSSLGDSGTKVRTSEMLSRSNHSAAPMPFLTMLEAFRIRLYVAAISSFS